MLSNRTFSATIDMFYIALFNMVANLWLLSTWNMASATEKQNYQFYLNLNNDNTG